ncbi:MAG: acyl-CoA thioesterase [Halobacteriota archaeon]
MTASDPSEFTFTYEHRVRFAETDAQGVVFYGNFATFQDEAVLAYYREIGHDYGDMLDEGWEVYIVHLDLDYHGPAHFGDHLRHGVRVAELGRSSITFEYVCLQSEDDRTIVDGSVVHVFADEEGTTQEIPDSFRTAIETHGT